MPLPQRHARTRPAFYGNSVPSSGSVSPASASSSLKTGVQGMTTSSISRSSSALKPGHLVPRKTTLNFIAASLVETDRMGDVGIVIDEDDTMVHPGPDDEVEDKVAPRRPVGLGELIAAHQGRGRPPRGPIAHRMGFDVIPNPSHHVLMPEEEDAESRMTRSPPHGRSLETGSLSSIPGLSRSDGTSSTVSPGNDHFPVLPLSKIPRRQGVSGSRDDEDGDEHAFPGRLEGQDEDALIDDGDDWDMVHPDPDPDAWVGIETGHQRGGSDGDDGDDDSEDELIFMDEESLMALRHADEVRKRQSGDRPGVHGGSAGDGLDYAAVLKG